MLSVTEIVIHTAKYNYEILEICKTERFESICRVADCIGNSNQMSFASIFKHELSHNLKGVVVGCLSEHVILRVSKV